MYVSCNNIPTHFRPRIILKIILKEVTQTVLVKDIKDILNYNQPSAQGKQEFYVISDTIYMNNLLFHTLKSFLIKREG